MADQNYTLFDPATEIDTAIGVAVNLAGRYEEDTGTTANAKVIKSESSVNGIDRKPIADYFNGMPVGFYNRIGNTAAVTANILGFGAKPVVGISGTPFTGGEMPVGWTELYYRAISDELRLLPANIISLDGLPIGEVRLPFLTTQAVYFSGSSKWLNLTENTTYDKTINTEYAPWFSAWGIGGDDFTTELFDERTTKFSTSSAGTTEEDALQGHYHRSAFFNGAPNNGFPDAALAVTGLGYDNRVTTGLQLQVSFPVTDGASGTPRTASVTRMKNIAVKVYVKII